MSQDNSRKEKIKAVLMVASGNFLEAYDFIVFGYYAAAIGQTFFPAQSEFASLMLSLMTFGAGFLMRPLGAIVLGAYMDHHGRRAGLLITLGLMAVGTATIAATPGYASIGILAPLIVLLGRLTQGLSQGAEAGGVSVYLSEIATPGSKGFYVAWQSASNQVAVVLAALLGLLMNSWLTKEPMTAWGWRVPLLIGCLMIPFIFYLRGSLKETAVFQARKHRPTMGQIMRSLVANWRIVLLGSMTMTMTTITFYFIATYTPTYGSTTLKLAATTSMAVTLCVGLANFILLPLMGMLSDRIGRRPQLLVCSALALLTGYPALMWLVASPSFGRLLAVELWLALIYAGYNGAMVVYLTEIMPPEVRTTAFSFAYSLGIAIFGGFTPAICTWLIHKTNDRAMPGMWLAFAGLTALVAVVVLRAQAAPLPQHLPEPAQAAK